jgi:hypothetical protein
MMPPSRLRFRLRSLDGANATNIMHAGARVAGDLGAPSSVSLLFPCYFPATVVGREDFFPAKTMNFGPCL